MSYKRKKRNRSEKCWAGKIRGEMGRGNDVREECLTFTQSVLSFLIIHLDIVDLEGYFEKL